MILDTLNLTGSVSQALALANDRFLAKVNEETYWASRYTADVVALVNFSIYSQLISFVVSQAR
jgi:hypothetical protein